MGSRLDLDAILRSLLGPDGHLYFQPPEGTTMQYPCITYDLDYMKDGFADNIPYAIWDRYILTVIDKDPDSPIPHRVKALPRSAYERRFITDNLIHTVFTLYF